MRRKVKSRLEGSVFNTRFKKQLEKKRLSKREHVILKTLFDEVKKDLKSNDFYQYYFDRNEEESFCDKDGTFTCQGPYRGLEDKKKNTCPDGHKINPSVTHPDDWLIK